GPPEQEWERKLMASQDTNFLGGGAPVASDKKVDKDLALNVTPEYKQGEYRFTLLENGDALESWAKGKGFTLPNGASAALAPQVASGMKVLVAEVDDKRIELVGGGRAQLSPIRYTSDKPIE